MYFLLDIGGTHLRACFSDGNSILRKEIIDTPQNFNDAIGQIKTLKNKLCAGQNVEKTVCGIAGLLEKDKCSLFFSPNLPYWNGKPLKQKLEEACGTNVWLENDAALAGLGEAVYGAGRDFGIVAYYTIGTGIGGTRIANKKIDTASYGFEPGHQIITFDENKKKQDMLEYFASGSGLTKRNGEESQEIQDRDFWNSAVQHIAVGVYNSILHWSPDVFVFGGGIINSSLIVLENIQTHLLTMPKQYPELPHLRKSELGDESGFWGALVFAKMQFMV